ncbi:S28 family serine protease [Endozoicomonas gorgoniicola]|uniref:S28 family serine protease n=1 Tax=Endozoicomonas gorgoniicola TaxID=1234144 RepID=A0ABT3MUH4_9GAMM|nr:S28 family serine protease [Endozoicomonas gorgoniicola]MCW7553042.1 S28 family serine protease [Endozoicomonas gorgoniicola]
MSKLRQLLISEYACPGLVISSLLILSSPSYSSEALWFNQQLDHYNVSDHRLFQQKYYLNTDSYSQKGPLLVTCGFEGKEQSYSVDRSAMAEYAKILEGAALAVEHRYFGDSKPFGSCKPGDKGCYKFLTIEQALQDCRNIINHVTNNLQIKPDLIISFGGSYGGVLGYLMRVHFPELIYGAVVSGAATKTIGSGLESTGIWFDKGVSAPYLQQGECAQYIEKQFTDYSTQPDKIKDTLHLCSKPDKPMTFFLNAKMMMSYVTQSNYARPCPPFKSSYPLNTVCSAAKNNQSALLAAMNLMYNSTGQVNCYDGNHLSPSYRATDENYQRIDRYTFGYLCCTQFVQPIGGKGIFSVDTPWSLIRFSKYCNTFYKVRPNPNWWNNYVFEPLKNTSRIIFVNAGFDPVRVFSPAIYEEGREVLNVNNMAHCENTLGYSSYDSEEVVSARQKILSILETWVKAK